MAVEARVVVNDKKLSQYIHELYQTANTLRNIQMGLHDIIGFEMGSFTLTENEREASCDSDADNEQLDTAAGT